MHVAIRMNVLPTATGASAAPRSRRRGRPRPRRRLRNFVTVFGALIASLSSVSITLLAFLIPSVEDQWDRWQAREVVERYDAIGQRLMREGRYAAAEATFGRAFELSENQRLDIEQERLRAKVHEVDVDPTWGAHNPEGLEEGDFLVLEQMQRGHGLAKERATTLDAYGVYLAGEHRTRSAEAQLRRAIALDPRGAAHHLNLGNVLGEESQPAAAEAEYRRAIALEPSSARAHYDLGLLLGEASRHDEAILELTRAAALDPSDADVTTALHLAQAARQHAAPRPAPHRGRRVARAAVGPAPPT